MEKALITVGKDQFTRQQIRSLEHIVIQNYKSYVSRKDLTVIWNLVPEGNAYKNNKRKQPSIITIGCDVDFPQERRVKMFEACSKDWLFITKQHSDDLVIAILERPTFEAFLKRSSEQLTTFGKLKFYSNLLLDLALTKTRNGYFAFDSSL